MATAGLRGSLIDRASWAFTAAMFLGIGIRDREEQKVLSGEATFNQDLGLQFVDFCQQLTRLAHDIDNPPPGFAEIANALRQTRLLADDMRTALSQADPVVDLYSFFPRLLHAELVGSDAVRRATEARQRLGAFALPDPIFEEADVVIATAGDLWRALSERKTLSLAVSSIQVGTDQKHGQVGLPVLADAAKRSALYRALALCDVEGGDRAAAMTKLIARVSLARNIDQFQVADLSIADFVEAVEAGQVATSPGSNQDAPDVIQEATNKPRRKRGRKKADYATEQRERAIYNAWQTAREAGVYKPDFAREQKMDLKQFKALLNRVAKRIGRSDN